MNLFIAGCPRSGTTALTRLVNLHPDVVVGLERFKGLYGKRRDFTPELFTRERFFDYREGDTNFLPATSAEATTFYGKADEKFDEAKFVGDKYPQFFRHYDQLFKNFPDAHVIFIFRDPQFVAQSWQRRSEDSTRWPAENDGRKAVGYWNDALAYTLAYKGIKRDSFTFVEYEEFFSTHTEGLFGLLRRIGARMDPEIEAAIALAAAKEFENSTTVLGQQLHLPKDVVRSVKHVADPNMHRRARRIAASDKTTSLSSGD